MPSNDKSKTSFLIIHLLFLLAILFLIGYIYSWMIPEPTGFWGFLNNLSPFVPIISIIYILLVIFGKIKSKPKLTNEEKIKKDKRELLEFRLCCSILTFFIIFIIFLIGTATYGEYNILIAFIGTLIIAGILIIICWLVDLRF